jgi:hypothetical protein
MTIVARIALADCEAALGDLAECGSDSGWSRRWVAFVALVRAVGHVLDHVDGERTPELRRAIDNGYGKLKASKPDPHIFWSFIEDERNVILKEYRFRGVHASGSGVTSLTASSFKTRRQFTVTSDRIADELNLHVFDEGPFAGRNHVDVAAEAVQWWKRYLDHIDALARDASSL